MRARAVVLLLLLFMAANGSRVNLIAREFSLPSRSGEIPQRGRERERERKATYQPGKVARGQPVAAPRPLGRLLAGQRVLAALKVAALDEHSALARTLSSGGDLHLVIGESRLERRLGAAICPIGQLARFNGFNFFIFNFHVKASEIG